MVEVVRLKGIDIIDIINAQLSMHEAWYILAVHYTEYRDDIKVLAVFEDLRTNVYQTFLRYSYGVTNKDKELRSIPLDVVLSNFIPILYLQLVLSVPTMHPSKFTRIDILSFRDIQMYADTFNKLPFPDPITNMKAIPRNIKNNNISFN